MSWKTRASHQTVYKKHLSSKISLGGVFQCTGRRIEKKQVEEVTISLEALVPEKHILRAIDKVINFSFIYETDYEKSSSWSRNIRFIITKDGENNGKDFMTDMSDSSQMVFPFGAFLLIKDTDSGVFESSDGGGKPNSSS